MTPRRLAARLYPWLLGVAPCAVAALVSVSAPGCGSKGNSALSGDDSDDASSSSGSSSGGGSSSSGSSGGGGSSSSSGTHPSGSGSSSGSTSGSSSGRVESNIVFNEAGVPLCGSVACNLTSNTCCVALNQTGSCIPQGQSCTSQEAQFKCLEASDCPSGQVCCGVANNSAGAASAGSECQDIAAAGHCSPVPDAGAQSTLGSAQLCQTNAECVNHMDCTWQVCSIDTTIDGVPNVMLMPNLTMCGLQSAAPFNCTAHQ
jgi:hypothetical protein